MNTKITIQGIPIEDLQRAKDVHLEGRTRHHPYTPTFSRGNKRGRKGTTKAKIFRRVLVDLGDRFRSVDIIPQIMNGKIVHQLTVVEK